MKSNNSAANSSTAKYQRVAPNGHVCGLCDKASAALIKMRRFDKQGTVLACGQCLRELMGYAPNDS